MGAAPTTDALQRQQQRGGRADGRSTAELRPGCRYVTTKDELSAVPLGQVLGCSAPSPTSTTNWTRVAEGRLFQPSSPEMTANGDRFRSARTPGLLLMVEGTYRPPRMPPTPSDPRPMRWRWTGGQDGPRRKWIERYPDQVTADHDHP